MTRPKTSCSAARPPSAIFITSSSSSLGVQVAILGRQVVGVAERVAARDDRHLLDREQVAHQVREQDVAGLVEGEDPLLLVGDDPALLEAGDDPLHRVLEVRELDRLGLAAAGEDRGLVADVGELGAGQPGGLAGDDAQVDSVGERLAARVHAQDLLAADEVGRGDEHLAIEAARPEQRRIEVLEPVRGAHHDDLAPTRRSRRARRAAGSASGRARG